MSLCWSLFAAVANTSQKVFQNHSAPGIPGVSAYDEGLFTPMEDMNALSEDEFTVLGHPALPNYDVRIKKSAFCDDTVKSYTGCIDIEARHIFFYFFESRNDPDTDDVIFWTNGSPGCSSSLGLFMELGPCRISDGNGTSFHPESWNTNANIFFVDQPIGVGFSYAEYGQAVMIDRTPAVNTRLAAKDIATFIFVFFEHFTKFKGRSFHMTGELYEVYDQNAKLAAADYTPINLMSATGFTDFYHQMTSSFDMQCTSASIPPILDIAYMKQLIPRCEKRLKESCVDLFDAINCAAVAIFCDTYLHAPFWQVERNPYDMSQPCDSDGLKDNLCYPVTAHIRAYLSHPAVCKMLGVDPAVPANFSCACTVGSAFREQMDDFRLTQDYVGGLLEHGVHVLIYVGTYDWICNWVGNEHWTLALEWSGQSEFVAEPLRPWAVGGDFTKGRAGLTPPLRNIWLLDSFSNFTDKPKEVLDLVQRWLSREGF
ncbi:Alpha/Beta hydrolase protein [Mycena epipterygia]|nr:Alpha/Beta hydrolase protein [Mycena epipterygia]